MILAINQPYFLPYIGYFQLIAAADEFVIYDNIKYTKKGWINRNRLLRNNEAITFTLPLKSASDHLDIDQRQISAQFSALGLLNQIRGAYATAPFYDAAMPVIADIISYPDSNLFGFLHHSILEICAYLEISTPIIVSSSIPIDHALRSEAKVIALCETQGADCYLNAIGGIQLYDRKSFNCRRIELKFLRSQLTPYPQYAEEFVPWLSILDVLMFNSREQVISLMLPRYEIIEHG